MKSMLKFVCVFAIVALVSACGDKKGGVNESGVEADGKCSKQMMADLKTWMNDFDVSSRVRDAAKAKAACSKFTTKYGAIVCNSTETGSRVNTQSIVDLCDLVR